MAEFTFYDGLVLGAVLLSVAFLIMFFGLMFVPAIWIPLLCGWPIIAAIAFFYMPVKTWIMDAINGPGVWYPQFGPRQRVPPPTYCRVCGGVLEYTGYRRGYCPTCKDYR